MSLQHSNGAPVCTLYGAHSGGGGAAAAAAGGAVGQGAVLAFSVLRPDGSFVGYRCAGVCQAQSLKPSFPNYVTVVVLACKDCLKSSEVSWLGGAVGI